MNAPFVVAQAVNTGQGITTGQNPSAPPRVVKLIKPQGEQAVVIQMDGNTKLDFTSISGEKITLVHVGERLVILFDNKSTVTIDPFFDSSGKPLQIGGIDLDGNRIVSAEEFASLFPITEDQSILPAAGTTGAPQNTGGQFAGPNVDPLSELNPLDLLPQEELGNFVTEVNQQPFLGEDDLVPVQTGARLRFTVEEEHQSQPSEENPSEEFTSFKLALGSGNEDPNDDTDPASPGTDPDGLDQDITGNNDNTTREFHGTGANALTALITGGTPPLSFAVVDKSGDPVETETGTALESGGIPIVYTNFDNSSVPGETSIQGWAGGQHVFTLTVESNGEWSFVLFGQLDHPIETTDTGALSQGALEEILGIDLTSLIQATDGNGSVLTLSGTGFFVIDVIDDTPTLTVTDPGVQNGFDFGNFVLNGNQWGQGSGVDSTSPSGAWQFGSTDGGPGSVQLERVGDGYLGMHSSTNGYMVDLDATANSLTLSQTLNLTSGETYQLSFEAGAPNAGTAHLKVFFGGVEVFDLNPTVGVMTTYTLNLFGGFGNGSNLLEFRETGPDDNHGTYLANVRIDDIIIDETPGVDSNSNDVLDLSSLFNGVTEQGSDPDTSAPEYAQGTKSVVDVTVSFGADGPNATNHLEFKLTLAQQGVASGLSTTEGKAIFLFTEGDFVVGRFDSNGDGEIDADDIGNAAFALTVDDAGILSIAQFVSLNHPNEGSHDEGIYLDDDILSVTVTAKDGDSDIITKTVDISERIRFEDDGPVLADAQGVSGEVDEDALNNAVTDGNEDAARNGETLGTGSVLFTGAAGSLLTLVDFGADGPGGTPFKFVSESAAESWLTGLGLTSGDFAVNDATISGNQLTAKAADGREIFKLTLNNDGSWQFQLLDKVDHPETSGPGSPLAFEDNTITVNLGGLVDAYDGDGDHANMSSAGFSITIRDDIPFTPGPSQSLITNGNFAEGNGWSAPDFWGSWSNTAPGWSISGTDTTMFERPVSGYLGMVTSNGAGMIDMGGSPGNLTISQNVAGMQAGQTYAIQFEAGAPFPQTAMLEVLWNNQVIGTIEPSGPGAMTSYNFIVTGAGNPSLDQLTFREIGTGNAPVGFDENGNNLQHEGYHGTYIANVKAVAVYVVDEDGLPTGNHDVQLGDAATNDAFVTGALGINWGADNHNGGNDVFTADVGFAQDTSGRSVVFTDTSVGISGGTLFSHGDAITISLNADGTKLIGTATHDNVTRTVFEVTLSDDESGKFHFILRDQLDHAANGDENDITLTFNYTATDSDGDKANGTFLVGVDDDVPVANANALVDLGKVHEDRLIDGNPEGAPSVQPTTAQITAVQLGALLSPGADENVTFSFNGLKDNQPAGVSSNGFAVSYDIVGNTVWGISSDGRQVFKLVDIGGGNFEFTLLDNLDHTPNNIGGGDAETLTLNLAGLFVATDHDGDSVILNGQLNVKVENDIPVIGLAPGNLIINGSFETFSPVSPPANGQWGLYSQVNGWTAANDIPFEIQVGNVGGIGAQDGNNKVELDSDTTGDTNPDANPNPGNHTNTTIQQTVDTIPGATYELTFWYSPRPDDLNPADSSMEVLWNGQVVHTIDSTTAAPGWQKITITVTAPAGPAGENVVLAFHGTGTETEYGAYIDNVSLIPVATVDEDGLPDGIGDSAAGDANAGNDNPRADDSNEATATGLLGITWGADNFDGATPDAYDANTGFAQDGVGRSVTFTNTTVGVDGVSSLTSHGETVTFEWSSDHTVLTAMAGSREVFQVSLSDDGSGAFRFVLLDQLDHAPGQVENDILLTFNYTATDFDGDTATGTFKVSIDDDLPVAVCETNTVDEAGSETVNLVLVFDRSGSMDGSKFALAKAAAINLLNTADVNQVMVVWFNDNAGHNTESGNVWTDKQSAIDYINDLNPPQDETNYDAAVEEVMDNWGSGPTAADQTLLYFFSDGSPNDGSIDNGEQADWEQFLQDKGVDASYAVGIGSGVTTSDPDLNDIAWPGTPIIIDDANDLLATLPSGTPNSVSGNVLTNDNFGADGPGGIVSITVDGVVYTFNGTNITYNDGGPHTINGSTLTVTTDAGGELTFYFQTGSGHSAGDYKYSAPSNVVNDTTETFTYVIADYDHDPVTAQLKITVTDHVPVVVGTSQGSVDEANLDTSRSHGSNDNDSQTNGPAVTATGSLAATVDFGSDPGTFAFNLAGATLPTLTSKGGAILFSVSGTTLTGYVDGNANGTYQSGSDRAVFTLTLNPNGEWTFTLLDQVDHVQPTNDTALTIDFSTFVVATESSPDSDALPLPPGTFTVAVIDDTPELDDNEHDNDCNDGPNSNRVVVADEDNLSNGIGNTNSSGDDSTDHTGTIGFIPGADENATVSFSSLHTDPVLNTSAGAVKSGGVALKYYWDGGSNTLYASKDTSSLANAQGTAAFKIVVNPATGAYTFTLLDHLDHANGGNENNINIDLAYTVTDYDGDQVEGALEIAIDDDMPVAVSPASVSVSNAVGATATVNLDNDGNVDDDIGADGLGSIAFANVPAGQDSGLTSGGSPVLLYVTNGGENVEGRTGGAGGPLVFTVTLNHNPNGADTYSVTMNGTVDSASGGATFGDLEGIDAGNRPFNIVESDSADGLQILLTPINETSINTDSDDIGVGGQWIDTETPDTGLRIDFGNFTFHDNGGNSSNDGFTINNHTVVNGFKFTIDQVSNGSIADVLIKAYNADVGAANQTIGTHNFGDDTSLTITEIKIFNASGTLIGTLTADGTIALSGEDIVVDFQGATGVSVTGLREDYSVQVKTASGFDRIEILNSGSSSQQSNDGKFSVSDLTVATINTPTSSNLTLDLALTDADGDTVVVSDALDITIAPVNQAPVADTPDTTPSTLEDQPIVINGFSIDDVDDSNVTVTLTATSTLTLSALAGLTFTNGDGANDQTMTFSGSIAAINAALNGMTYAPTPNFNGTGSISYVIDDGTDTTSGTFNINIAPVNDAPVTPIDTNGLTGGSVPENSANGTAVGITASSSDIESAMVTYSLADNAGGRFAINSSTGIVTVANGLLLNFEAANSHSITVQASDGTGGTSTQAFTINVTDVNEQPNAGADFPASAAENVNDTTVLATVTGTDPDTGGGNDGSNTFENLTYSLFSDPSNKFEINSAGQISLKAGQSLDFESAQQHVVTVRTTDGGGLFDDVQVTINVTDVNEQPNAGSDFSASAAENVNDTTVLATVTGTDPDTGGGNDGSNTFENLTYSLFSDPSNKFEINSAGQISLKSGQSLNFEAAQQHVVTVRTTDGGGLFDDVQVTINVTDVNEQPNAGADFPVSAAENVNDTTVLATVTGTDPDTGGGNDASNTFENLTYSLFSDPSNKFEINSAGEISLKAGQSLNFEAAQQHVVTVRTTDGGGLFDDVQVTINVTDVAENQAPVANNDTLTSVLNPPSGTGWEYNAANGHYYKFVATDLLFTGATAAATAAGGYLATVTSAAENAFLTSFTQVMAPDGWWLGGSDQSVEGTWRWATGPENGTTLSYFNWQVGEPSNSGGGGGEDFLVLAWDGKWNDSANNSAWPMGYIIEINGTTSTPTEDASFSVSTATLLGNDTDANGDTLSVISVQDALHGAVSLNGTMITFTPTANYYGAASFTYTISDGNGGQATATASFTIAGVNDAPVAFDNVVVVNAAASNGSQMVIPEWALLWNDSDPDGDALDITAASLPGGSDLSAVTPAPAGSITVTNNSDTDWGNFNYTLTANGQTDTANVSIEIDTSGPLDRNSGSGNGGADVYIDIVNNAATTINAGMGNDVLIGGNGNDILNGELDNDLLVGGTGTDALSGGGGADTFAFFSGEYGVGNVDTISDYSRASGDKLDLTGLLNALYGGSQSASNVQLIASSPGSVNLTVQVDTTTGAGTNWQNVAVLSGYNTGGSDQVDIVLNNMTNQTQTYSA